MVCCFWTLNCTNLVLSYYSYQPITYLLQNCCLKGSSLKPEVSKIIHEEESKEEHVDSEGILCYYKGVSLNGGTP